MGERQQTALLAADLQIFLQRRAAGPTPKPTRRRRKNPEVTEFF